MDSFAKIINGEKLLTILQKSSILVVWQHFKYAPAQRLYIIRIQKNTDKKIIYYPVIYAV